MTGVPKLSFLDVQQVQPAARADHEVMKNGRTVCMLAGPRSWDIEHWVSWLRVASGQRVDWSFVGGRAVVLAIGDIDRVRWAVEISRDILNRHYRYTQIGERADDMQFRMDGAEQAAPAGRRG